MATTITDLDIELYMKISRIEYLKSKLIYTYIHTYIHTYIYIYIYIFIINE